ncbi:MAG: hypothetical protein ABFS38_00230 [Bacteroidota bacterium]
MRKALTLIFLLALLYLPETGAHAQDKGLMASYGGATFRMDDLKYFQEYILSTYPVEGKIISSFPPYPSASVSFFKQWFPQVRIGAGYAYTSTGGKSDYTDYSGNIHTTIMAASHRVGAFVSYTVLGNDHFDLSLFGRLDANLTRVEVSSSIYAGGYSNALLNEYRSISPNASTGLELTYSFKDFAIGMDGGYLVDFPGDLTDNERDSKLYDPVDGERILTSDWTGWRASIKVIFWLNF